MESQVSFTIEGDSEGYVTFECPYCGSEFKLHAGELQNVDEPVTELFCPYCGLSKETFSFYSHEIIEKARALAMNNAIKHINKSFNNLKRSVNGGNNVIKVSYKPLSKANVKDLKEKDTVDTQFQCNICKHSVKVLYCAGEAKIFCPYCGVDIE